MIKLSYEWYSKDSFNVNVFVSREGTRYLLLFCDSFTFPSNNHPCYLLNLVKILNKAVVMITVENRSSKTIISLSFLIPGNKNMINQYQEFLLFIILIHPRKECNLFSFTLLFLNGTSSNDV